VSNNEEQIDFEEMLHVFADLPIDECADEDFETIEIELHQGCRFTRQCKLRTSRLWPFGSLGTDTLEASRIKAIETLSGDEADWFLRELAKTKSIKKTYPKSTFLYDLDEPEREDLEQHIWDQKEYYEEFSSPDSFDIDPNATEEEIAEYLYDGVHTDLFDPLDYLDMVSSEDGKSWSPKAGSECDREHHYHFMDCYVLLHGEKIRPQDRSYFSKAVKGFMVLNGPTYYIDSYSGGDVGECFIGRVRIGNRLLTEEQLVEFAERYVSDNSYMGSV